MILLIMEQHNKRKLYSWEISDEFWSKVEPLLPRKKRDSQRKYLRDFGGGRKPIPPRIVLAGIVYVLRTGIQWKALPKSEFGSPSAIHRYFLEWQKAGFFKKMWKAGLAEYDEVEGIAWEWQSIDGGLNKAPLALEDVGHNPTDRGKKWEQTKHSRRRSWYPVVSRRQRSPETRRETANSHLG
jgi:transposase